MRRRLPAFIAIRACRHQHDLVVKDLYTVCNNHFVDTKLAEFASTIVFTGGYRGYVAELKRAASRIIDEYTRS